MTAVVAAVEGTGGVYRVQNPTRADSSMTGDMLNAGLDTFNCEAEGGRSGRSEGVRASGCPAVPRVPDWAGARSNDPAIPRARRLPSILGPRRRAPRSNAVSADPVSPGGSEIQKDPGIPPDRIPDRIPDRNPFAPGPPVDTLCGPFLTSTKHPLAKCY